MTNLRSKMKRGKVKRKGKKEKPKQRRICQDFVGLHRKNYLHTTDRKLLVKEQDGEKEEKEEMVEAGEN